MGYAHVLITKDNLNDYIDIPKFIWNRLDTGSMSLTHFSDYVRLSLLCKYGGIWADAACFFSSKIPEPVGESNLFFFCSPTWLAYNNSISISNVASVKNIPYSLGTLHAGSSWFIVAKNGKSFLLRTVKKILEIYWGREDRLIDYYLFHCAVVYSILSSSQSRDEFVDMIKRDNVLPHIMQFNLLSGYDNLVKLARLSFCHKLNWKAKYTPCQEKRIIDDLSKILIDC